jgi:hypothetical protein
MGKLYLKRDIKNIGWEFVDWITVTHECVDWITVAHECGLDYCGS